MKYEVTHKGGRKEVMEYQSLPKVLSPNFKKVCRDLKLEESVFDVTSMIDVKRVKEDHIIK